jgi:hypothetical protein
MSVHMTRWFARWSNKNGLSGATLCGAIVEIQRGLVDADLGGGLLKKRVGASGRGKRGSYRTLIATNRSSEWTFIYGFAKSERTNVDRNELAALKKLSAQLLALSETARANAKAAGELIEVDCDEEPEISDP